MSLKELTSVKHKEIEDMPFTQYMLSGNISKEDYAKYLYQMQVVYGAIEEVASNLNILDNFPTLPRFYLIKHDYEELMGTNIQHSILPATKEYQDYIKNLTDIKKVYAHMYVRYMGDMAGGQMIKKLVPGSGSFYDFENLRELMTKFREKLTDDLAEEAIVAFNYNIAITRQLDTSRICTWA
jgi:heme oxygenase